MARSGETSTGRGGFRRESPSPSSVLVVDDDDLLRDMMVRVFEERGFRVEEAGDGVNALAWLKERCFDVVLLDEHMPGKSGLGVLEEARQSGCEAVFIMVTVDRSTSLVVQAIKAGAVEFVEKPFLPRELLETVERYGAAPPAVRGEEDRIVDFIQTHFAQIHTEEEVAQRLGMSVRTVSRHVLQRTRQSFGAFLGHCRIETAKALLASTGLNIAQIADRVGFSGPEVLAHAFKRAEGMTPTEYRIAARAKKPGRGPGMV